MMNPVAQEDGPQKAPTASRFLKVHPEKVLGFKRVRCANKKAHRSKWAWYVVTDA
ncbi:hypothetical protein GCM10009414_20810 [Tatumella terrea]